MLKIELLKQHPTLVPVLTNMWHDLLGCIWVPDVTIERVQAKFHEHLNDDKLPLTLVAFDNDKPVGMCSLRENDGIQPDLKPWLGSLVVDKSHQGQGVARVLIDETKTRAKGMGFDKLYLFAFDPTLPDYYQRHGWKIIGMDEFKDHAVTVMMIDL